MMKIVLRIFLALIGLYLLIVASLFLLFPRWVKGEVVEQKIVQLVESEVESDFLYTRSDHVYFPFWSITFHDAALNLNGQNRVNLKAKKLHLRLQVIPYLFGKIRFSKIRIEEGAIEIKSILGQPLDQFNVDHVSVYLKTLPGGLRGSLVFEGDFANVPKAVSGKMVFSYDSLASPDWNSVNVQGDFRLAKTFLHEIESRVKLPFKVKSGEIASGISFVKKRGDKWLGVKSDAKVSGFAYEVMRGENALATPVMDLEWKSEVLWDPVSEELVIKRGRWATPIGALDVSGNIFGGNREIRELRLLFPQITLEMLPQYWLFPTEAIPANIGFSGQGDVDLTLQGTWDHLAFHASLDLSSALLTYSRFFSKSKGVPLLVTLDGLLKDTNSLNGDFSVRFEGATAKGALKRFDLSTGDIQFNMITNKFQLSGWETLLVPFQNYNLEGNAKILANWEGNIHDKEKAQRVLNVTLEDGSIARGNGPSLRDVHLAMDYSGYMLTIKNAEFKVGDSIIDLQADIYPNAETPQLTVEIDSAYLEPMKVFETVQDLSLEWLSPEKSHVFENSKAVVESLFPAGEHVENLMSKFSAKDQTFTAERLEMEAYGGKFSLKGNMAMDADISSYQTMLEINNADIAKFFMRGGKESPFAQGTLFMNMSLYGGKPRQRGWIAATEGKGTFLLTKGSLNRLNLMSSIAAIPQLQEVADRISGVTALDDLRAQFVLQNGKIRMDNLVMISPDLFMESKGEADLNGVLNFRLGVYLSEDLTQRILGSAWGARAMKEGSRLGPIPFLLSGAMTGPVLQADSELMPKFLENLSERKSQKVLRNFLPEELLFERTGNS